MIYVYEAFWRSSCHMRFLLIMGPSSTYVYIMLVFTCSRRFFWNAFDFQSYMNCIFSVLSLVRAVWFLVNTFWFFCVVRFSFLCCDFGVPNDYRSFPYYYLFFISNIKPIEVTVWTMTSETENNKQSKAYVVLLVL